MQMLMCVTCSKFTLPEKAVIRVDGAGLLGITLCNWYVVMSMYSKILIYLTWF